MNKWFGWIENEIKKRTNDQEQYASAMPDEAGMEPVLVLLVFLTFLHSCCLVHVVFFHTVKKRMQTLSKR